ncbi:MAG: hypothetical protein ACPHVX_04795, partial [Flavobacteriaceae bacterium]
LRVLRSRIMWILPAIFLSKTCKNYDVLTRTDRSMCLCTGMLHDPNDKNKTKSKTTAFLSGLFKKKSK